MFEDDSFPVWFSLLCQKLHYTIRAVIDGDYDASLTDDWLSSVSSSTESVEKRCCTWPRYCETYSEWQSFNSGSMPWSPSRTVPRAEYCRRPQCFPSSTRISRRIYWYGDDPRVSSFRSSLMCGFVFDWCDRAVAIYSGTLLLAALICLPFFFGRFHLFPLLKLLRQSFSYVVIYSFYYHFLVTLPFSQEADATWYACLKALSRYCVFILSRSKQT